MANIAAWLIGILVRAIGPALGRWVVSLGIGLVTYGGVLTLFNSIKAQAFSFLDQAHSSVIGQYMGVFRIGQIFSILFSAVLVRMTIKGLSGGAIKKWVTK